MREVERIVQTRNTKEFIGQDSISVRFQRTEKRPNMRGGVQQSGQWLTKVQQVRFVTTKQRAIRPALTSTTIGRVQIEHDHLLAMPDADIKVGDIFELNDTKYKISRVIPKAYELIAELDLHNVP